MPPKPCAANEPQWVSSMVRAEPRLPLMGPYMAYLLLLLLTDVFPQSLYHVAVIIHVAVAFWVTWLFRHHYPPWGRMHLGAAAVVGVLAAVLWVAGQHWLNGVRIAGHDLGAPLWGAKTQDPNETFGNGLAFWGQVVVKIGRSVTIVPIVEELFWRGFILRAFVSWDRFEQVPWGRFTWFAFLGSSLLSTLQHPTNWGVSIACWMLYNALFYWKKSLLCMMITHGITNLVLYIYVVQAGDWQFW
ncbi:MAG TPA: CAAX prenyl protease-related protein [Phycisphaerae bacterium]|nr:CAAX prenyl protease-related protein [Phycisphaerae bacterium]